MIVKTLLKTLFLGGLIGGSIVCNGQAPALRVVGNQFQDDLGNKVILRGVSIEHLHDQAKSSIGINGLTDLLTNKNDNSGSSPGWYTKLIRFPVDAHEYNKNPNHYMDTYIKPSVDYATTKGLYIIIDWHYVDDVNVSDHDEKTKAFWHHCAPIFKDYTNVWYELFNEPKMALGWWDLRNYYQTWTDIVRSHAPENIILIGSEFWSQNPQHACDNPVNGSNLAYVMHMYANHHPQLNGNVESAARCAPVVMTEWGFRDDLDWDPQGGDQESISTFGQPVIDLMDTHGVSWTAWAASEDYLPAMFYPGWALRIGEGEMGGFVKDKLYERRNWDQPQVNTGPFTLTIQADGGTVKISPNKSEYALNEEVTLTATAGQGNVFIGWAEDASGSDKTITVKMTKNRVIQASFFAPPMVPAKIEAENYQTMDGIQLEPTTDNGGGENVGYIDPSDQLSYVLNFSGTGTYEIDFRLAANVTGGGKFDVQLDGNNLFSIDAPNTGDWQAWQTFTSPEFEAIEGQHTLTLVAEKGGFNINYFEVVGVALNTTITEEYLATPFKVYPNPTSDQVYIEGFWKGMDANVRTLDGRLIKRVTQSQVDLSELSPGTYLIQLEGKHLRLIKR